MSTHAHQKLKAEIIVIGLLALVIAVILIQAMSLSVKSAKAQATQPSMQELFLQMNEQRLKDEDFVFGVEFVVPLGSESLWRIGDPNDQYRRSIEKIGMDYVCFRERHDSFQLARCTPFSNISEISYMMP